MTKTIATTLAILTMGLFQLGMAEETKTTTYEVTMTGVT